MKRFIACSVVVLLLSASPVWASHIYSTPSGQPDGISWSLLPNTPDQQVMVYVMGNDSVAAFDFDVTIGGGGQAWGVNDVGPRITDVVLNGTGMVFANCPQSPVDIFSPDAMYAYTNVTTSSGAVSADGLLVKLTIDTTGFSSVGQSWALAMDYSDFVLDDASGTKLIPTISNGVLTIVPEPGTLVLLASLLVLLPAVACWRRKRLAA